MTKHPIGLAFAMILTTAAILSGCNRTTNFTEQEHIQRAKDFEDKGNLKGSIIELKNAIQKNPDSPEARLLLGQIYLKTGLGAEAEKELTHAEKLGVNHETIQIQLGEALLLMGEYNRVLDEIQPGSHTSKVSLARIQQIRADALINKGKLQDACNLYEQSLSTDTTNPPTYWGLAKCAIAKKNTAKAKELLATALKINNKQGSTWVHIGDLSRFDNNSQEALVAYTNALKLEPNNLEALERRTNTNILLSQSEKARKDLDIIRKLSPKSVPANYLTALLYFQQKKFPEAHEALQEVFKITDNYMPSVLLAGTTAYALGSYQQAEGYLNQYLARFPDDSYARKALAATKIKQNQPDKALEVLSPLLIPSSQDVQALSLAGEAHLRNKDYNKAMGYLDHASELDPKNAAIRTQRATGHLARGESDKALFDLEQAVSLSEKAGRADLMLITLELGRKEYDQAIEAVSALEKKLPNNPITQYFRAIALLGKQDQAGARKALDRALTIQPNFFPAAASLARFDMAENKPDAARQRFEAILDNDKNNIHAMLALAELSALEKKESENVSWLKKAIQADPKAIKPRATLVRYHLTKKENQKALNLANEAVNNNPDSLEALELLGTTQMATGNKAASITTFTRITKKAPQSPGALLTLALAQIADKQRGNARVNLLQALQFKPDFIQAQEALIRLELLDNKSGPALQIARQIQVQQPMSPAGFDREADILLSQKHYLQAIKAYEQALTKESAGSSGLIIKLHRALAMSGNAKSAEQRLNLWLKQNPNDIAVRSYAAEYYLSTNQNHEAITEYEKLIKLAPQSALVLNNLANLYLREKDSRALTTAEQAFKLSPDHPFVQDTLGWILLGQGQVPRGIDLLRKATSKAPKSATIKYHYAVALVRNGNKVAAKNELAAVISLGQKFPELEEAKALLKSL